MKNHTRATLALIAVAVATTSIARAGDYRLERVASGLTQPNYLTQAPGDPKNVVYYVERVQADTSNAYSIQAFSKVNHMGKIVRYDLATGTKTTVLDLYDRKVFQDTGLQQVSFNPDFQTDGKFYVTNSTYTGTQAFGSNGAGTQPIPTNRVEEYTLNVADPSAATTSLTRTVLNYTNDVGNNHTINGAWFDPTATGAARTYLHISTGDGAFGNNYNSGSITGGRPSQNPASSRGKILRVDVNGADAYPSDPNKNFAIPASNPLPAYNAAHPQSQIAGNGEAWVTGMRNAYRISFDRANGNLLMGDVGENAIEEIDFLKAGSNEGGTKPPADFGWPQLEGTFASPVGGAPHTNLNPFTNATSINPIQQFPHSGGSAVIGGYVYRGPIAELKGKYFYADFVPGTLRSLDFDPNTDPAAFNGENGSVTDVSATFDGVVFDRNDPNYSPALGGPAFGLDHVVSFGDDNSGNLYIVDFGGTAGDGGFTNNTGEYPAGGLGEIFRLVLNGDFDLNNVRDAADIDRMLRAAPGTTGNVGRLFDLNNDNAVVVAANTINSDSDYLIKTLLHTYYGDANLDRIVSFADLVVLAQNYGQTSAALGWAAGDFDGDNTVGFGDLVALAQNYGQRSTALGDGFDPQFAADWALARSLVPEPGAAALALASIPLAGRRLRQH